MSVQFGRWDFGGRITPPAYFERAKTILGVYGPDGQREHVGDGIRILYFQFHTTFESRLEVQPFIVPSGTLFVWDGRLDNREELVTATDDLKPNAPDVQIAARAFAAWGAGCLGKFVGDWALAIWQPDERSLLLARDFLGVRPLFYLADEQSITWSSVLDPLVLCSDKNLELEKECLAGWLSSFPSEHLTPYRGICAVPPASFVLIRAGSKTVQRYWDFNSEKTIRYRSDDEYQEHFLAVFREAVKRRLRSDSPILAELSGGVDSSSIVCVADDLIAQQAASVSRFDTISYFNRDEPNWNEEPYFARVEARRGRTGLHVDVGNGNDFRTDRECFGVLPSSKSASVKAEVSLARCLRAGGHRVVLSGIGGDEVLGGVPNPLPELADLLVTGRFEKLARKMLEWALPTRKPLLYLIQELIFAFLPPSWVPSREAARPAPWLANDFVKSHKAAIDGYPRRFRWFSQAPSFQANLATLEAIRRQLSCACPPQDQLFEKRYPFLDRTLLEFLFAIPREQIVRPLQRRSLMRRALRGIVPEEILDRRRKAFIARSPLMAIAQRLPNLQQASPRNMLIGSLGLVDQSIFLETLRRGCEGQPIATLTAVRTLVTEEWLRQFEILDCVESRATFRPKTLYQQETLRRVDDEPRISQAVKIQPEV